MPTYEYRCLSCNNEFERFQKMSDAPVQVCPECGGKVKRLISTGAGIVFKQKGFSASQSGSNSCCGQENPCDNPKRCCGSH